MSTVSATAWSSGILPDQMFPAMPTDTSSVLLRMLALSEKARRQQATSGEKQIIPRTLLLLLLHCMKLQDPDSLLHGQRIAAISSGIARLLGWDDEQRRQLEVAALLHDVGKLGVPEHILRKPGKLSSEEYDFVLLHHHAAVNLLQAFHTDLTVVSMLSMLYEDVDKSCRDTTVAGRGTDLPLGPRILAVADAYDSLCTPKSYRRGMTHAETIAALEERSGSRYDGNIVRTLNRWHEVEGDSLFKWSDPFLVQEQKPQITDEQRNEMMLLAQFINVLYQFQALYDGYFLLDSNENYCIWSDGMPRITGLDIQSVLGRTWQPSDVLLSPLTTDAPAVESRNETMVGQVLKNGRAQFGSRLCRVSETRHVKVDVYTMPIAGPGNTVQGVVQLLRNKSGVRRQTQEYVELKLAATRDALTGVANRGQLETQLRHLLEDFHASEGTRPLSTIFLDVDRFKSINDNYGHQVGDHVLVDLSRLLQQETYSGEIIGRYGGEEFVVLCPDTDLEAAVRRAERLRHAIVKGAIGGISTLNVTSSFGVSTVRLGDSVQTLLERADACLYRAKQTGRNRTCAETDTQDSVPAGSETATDRQPQISVRDEVIEFREIIEVATSLELTAMKLQAFLREKNAAVLSQEHGTLHLRIGSFGFLKRWGFNKRWGKTIDKQPIEVHITFGTSRAVNAVDGRQKTIRQVSMIVQPHGQIPDSETFAQRCGVLMRELRAYLLGS